MQRLKTIKIVLLSLVACSVALSGYTQSAAAAPVIGFNAGRIIDDSVFVNKNTMTAQQIQSFFWSKGSGCINGESACLKQYYENGRVAAQIVYDTAQEFSINPQVLIATLQKETGLVTANQPQNWRYKTAMGYGCPDSTPGVCNSNYYGFTNQMRWAARMFRAIMNASPTWYTPYVLGNNYIQWSPTSSCGGSNVYIQNRATQALYNYTPYRPNQAAINAGYGTGDGCSAYGNRNFYLYFTDWFGSPRGMLVRTENDPTVYLYDDGRKVRLSSMELAAQYGIGASDLKFINQQEMDSIPLASAPYSSDLGQVVKSISDSDEDGGSVYIVDSGRRVRIGDYQTFVNYGLQNQSIVYLSLATIKSIPEASNTLTNFIQAPDLSPFQMNNTIKRVVLEMSKLNQLNPSGAVTPFSWFTLGMWPNTGAPLVDDSAYTVIGPNGGVRLYTGDSYHDYGDINIYNCWGLSNLKQFRIPSYDRVGGTFSGVVTSCFARSGANTYLMGGEKKYLFSTQSPAYEISPLSQNATTQALKPAIMGSSDEISFFESSTRRPITNMTTFNKLGLSDTDIERLPQGTYLSIPQGALKYAVGDLIAEPDGGISIVSSSTERLKIVSAQQFDHYKFSWRALNGSTPSTLSSYSLRGNLPFYVKSGSDVYLVDSGTRYRIEADLDAAFGISRAGIIDIPQELLSATSLSTATKFIKSQSGNEVYMLQGGQKRLLGSWETYLRESNGGAAVIKTLSGEAVSRYTTGQILN